MEQLNQKRAEEEDAVRANHEFPTAHDDRIVDGDDKVKVAPPVGIIPRKRSSELDAVNLRVARELCVEAIETGARSGGQESAGPEPECRSQPDAACDSA